MIARPLQPPATATKETPLRPGAGVLMGRNPLGTWVESPGRANFSHPFPVYAGGGRARVGKGLILIEEGGIEPRIGRVPISGDKEHRQPSIRLDADMTNALGESWICVEVTPDDEGKVVDGDGQLLAAAKVEAVQASTPTMAAGPKGRAPLALLVFTKSGAVRVIQIAYFHLRYHTARPDKGYRRHFFT